MKRILIAFLGILVLASVCSAADSKEYTFARELIECLNRSQFSLGWSMDANAEYKGIAQEVTNANSNLEQGKQLMQKYIKDNDENIKRIAIDTVVGIDNLIDANLRFLELIRKKGSAQALAQRSLEKAIVEIVNEKDIALSMILDSAVTLPTVIAQKAKEDYPIGPIPFKITPEEKRSLLGQLNRSFQNKLTKFDIASEQKKLGKEYDPAELSGFALTAALIYDELSSEKYEEFRQKVYRYIYNF